MNKRRFLLTVIMIAAMVNLMKNANAQVYGNLDAVDDYAVTGPMQPVTVDILLNDTFPCLNNPQVKIIEVTPSTLTGYSLVGTKIKYVPVSVIRKQTVHIKYELTCNGVDKDTAIAHIEVREYNLPANIIDPHTVCVDPMPNHVDFQVHEKYNTKEQNAENIALDGFSMPLVGDINGDGKPEVVALGLTDGGGTGVGGIARYIHIFDGQNGKRIWTIDFQNANSIITTKITKIPNIGIFTLRTNPLHNSPGHLAMADLNKDGTSAIVLASTGVNAKIYVLTPVLDADKNITDFSVLWSEQFKDPLQNQNQLQYGAGIPSIADINGDGNPEIIIYNKIFDAHSGTKCETLETLNTFSNLTSSNITSIRNNYAYVGRQPGTPNNDNYTPCMAIADMDGDGILDLIAGSKIYKMKDDNGVPKLDKVIQGPWKVNVKHGNNYANSSEVYLADGFTAVADIDMDGALDVIVINMVARSGDDHKYILYVWDMAEAAAAAAAGKEPPCKAAMLLYEDGWQGYISYPFVGDINGRLDSYDGTKRMPEFCFVTGRLYTNGGSGTAINNSTTSTPVKPHPLSVGTNSSTHIITTTDGKGYANNQPFNNNNDYAVVSGFVLGWTWHANPDGSTPIEERLKLSWVLEHKDRSQMTGISMFDFDNDGAMDLCYKDEQTLRVISPSMQSYIKVNAPHGGPNDAIRFQYPDSRPSGGDDAIISYTGYEAPVIADVNLDGSADIVIMAEFPPVNSRWYSRSYIYVYEYAAGSDKWAPCSPIWNQTLYRPLLIDEDMTVPAKPRSRLDAYTKNSNTIYPYNSHWVQQPIVLDDTLTWDYTPAVRLPNVDLYDMSVSVTNNGKDAKVTLHIRNRGSASIGSNTPVAFYNGNNGTSGAAYDIKLDRSQLLNQKLAVRPLGRDIFPGEADTVSFTFTNYSDGYFNKRLIWASIMDDATQSDPNNYIPKGFKDCDPTNLYNKISSCVQQCEIDAADTFICRHKDGSITPLELGIKPFSGNGQTRTYQWYMGNSQIPGATSAIYKATKVGKYYCHVQEGICIAHSDTITITFGIMEAYNDTVIAVSGMRTPLLVTRNDFIPKSCSIPPITITSLPLNGTAASVPDTIYYTSVYGFSGVDSLTYSLTADGKTSAKVYIRVVSAPDNIVDATCVTSAPSAVTAGIRELLCDTSDTRMQVNNFGPLTVGDIDGDGVVEIIGFYPSTYGSTRGTEYRPSEGLRLFYVDGDSIKWKRDIFFHNHNVNTLGSMAIARYNNTGYIVVGDTDGRLRAYNGATGDTIWTTPPSEKLINVQSPLINIADFNNDSIPEIYVGNYIYSLATGRLLCKGSANKGILNPRGTQQYLTAAADMTGDGRLELIAGSQIYRVDIPAKATGYNSGSMSVIHDISNHLPSEVNPDGATQVADIDNDGQLEVVVVAPPIVGRKLYSGSNGSQDYYYNTDMYLYAWKPTSANEPIWLELTDSILLYNVYTPGPTYEVTDSLYFGIPSIGNIDSDPYPEIYINIGSGCSMLNSNWLNQRGQQQSLVFKYVPSRLKGKRLDLFFNAEFSTNHGNILGVSFFDVYKKGYNHTILRLPRGLAAADYASHYLPVGSPALTSIYQNQFTSPFYFRESPIVADVDDDGDAEIIFQGNTEQNNLPDQIGYIKVFKSSGTKWGSSRKVWNQYAYNAVNVTDSLTIPAYQFNIATELPNGKRVYNGFRMQQGIIDKNGDPLWLVPDVYPVANSIVTNIVGDSISVTVCVKNQGPVVLTPPIYVSVYHDTIRSQDRMATDSLNVSIKPGASACIDVTVPIRNIKPFEPFVQLLVRVNDDGKNTPPVQEECDYLNNADSIQNPYLSRSMTKTARLNGITDNGIYANPVSVLGNEIIEYTIKGFNVHLSNGTNARITDTLPAYLEFDGVVSPTPQPSSTTTASPTTPYQVLEWTFNNQKAKQQYEVKFKTKPRSGSVASQPMFANKAWVKALDATGNETLNIATNSTYHQGAGISIVTFSAGLGGSLFNVSQQALDYKSSPRGEALIVPDSGYVFAGWSHDEYISMRGNKIAAQSGVMNLDTLIIYGDVELRANFMPESAIGINYGFTPSDSLVLSTVDRVWSVGEYIHLYTQKQSSVVRVYSSGGVLLQQQSLLSGGETRFRFPFPSGIYIVTINNGTGYKVKIE